MAEPPGAETQALHIQSRPIHHRSAAEMATWVMQMMSATGYIGLVFLMVLENVFPPIPSEVIMPLAGFMATQDRLSLLGVILAGTLGSVLGALPLYYLGHKIGDER